MLPDVCARAPWLPAPSRTVCEPRCASLASSPASADWSAASKRPASVRRFCRSRATRSVAPFSLAIGPTSKEGTMSRKFAAPTSAETASSAEGSPVRTSAVQGGEKVSPALGAVSGTSSDASSKRAGRARSSSKTSAAERSAGSPLSAPTLWLSAIESAPWGLPPETLAPLIGGSESSSSLFATPRASDENGPGVSSKRQGSGDLRSQVVFAAPTARDWRSGEASEATMARNARPLNEQVVSDWATPLAQNGTGGPSPTQRRDLQREVLWPTATATDAKASGAAGYSTVREFPTRRSSSSCRATGVVLNPAWVEALMGFPPGWTDVAIPLRAAPRKKRGSRRA